VLGNEISPQAKRVRAGVMYKDSECDEIGFCCSRCGQYSCRKCVLDIFKEMDKVGRTRQARMKDPTCVSVQGWIDGLVDSPASCHACMLGVKKELSAKRRQFVDECRGGLRGDGMLILPQFGIGFGAPMSEHNFVDVHGMGAEGDATGDGLPGAFHFVPNVSSCRRLFESDSQARRFPQRFGQRVGNVTRHLPQTVVLPDYVDPLGEGRTVLVDVVSVIQLPHNDRFTETGWNDLGPEEFEQLLVMDENDMAKDYCDITIVYGVWRSEEDKNPTGCLKQRVKKKGSLLTCRHYDVFTDDINNRAIEALYKVVTGRIDNGGYCVNRQGGSSGLYDGINMEHVEAIKSHRGICPKAGFGQWWLPNGTNMDVFYKNKDADVKSYTYSVPRAGGQFDCDPFLMEKFPFLYDYAETKITTALLLSLFNQYRFEGNPLELIISPGAVDAELQNLENWITTRSGHRRQAVIQCMGNEAPGRITDYFWRIEFANNPDHPEWQEIAALVDQHFAG